jgi:hypothetical protein
VSARRRVERMSLLVMYFYAQQDRSVRKPVIDCKNKVSVAVDRRAYRLVRGEL